MPAVHGRRQPALPMRPRGPEGGRVAGMHVEVIGRDDGPDVVCLHGGVGAGRYHWQRQIPYLQDRFRLHLPDLPGHGRSPLEGEPSREAMATAVEAYLKDLDAPAHVLGFSMGGHVALHLAARRPDLFASLGLFGVAIRDHPGLPAWRERFVPERLESRFPLWARMLQRVHQPLGGPDAWREVARRDSSGVLEVDADLEALGDLTAPVLLVRGDRDPVVEPSQYAELRRIWPHADEFVVPAGAHDAHITRHQLVGPAVRDFLDRAADASS